MQLNPAMITVHFNNYYANNYSKASFHVGPFLPGQKITGQANFGLFLLARFRTVKMMKKFNFPVIYLKNTHLVDQSKGLAHRKFVQTNGHLGYTLSSDQQLF